MGTAPSPSSVFVIRIWLEPGAGGGSRRGYVEDVATKERRYFSVLADAAEFISVLGAMPLDSGRELP